MRCGIRYGQATMVSVLILCAGATQVEAQRPPVDTSGWPSIRITAQSSLPSTLLHAETTVTTVQAELVLRSGLSPFVGMGSLHERGSDSCAVSSDTCSRSGPPWGATLGLNHRWLAARPNVDRDQLLIPYVGVSAVIPVNESARLPRGWLQAGTDVRLADGWNLRLELRGIVRGAGERFVGTTGVRIAVP